MDVGPGWDAEGDRFAADEGSRARPEENRQGLGWAGGEDSRLDAHVSRTRTSTPGALVESTSGSRSTSSRSVHHEQCWVNW